MRIITTCLLLSAFLQLPANAEDSTDVPHDFAYTEIRTTFSEQGVPAQTEVARVMVSGRKLRHDHFEGHFTINDHENGASISVMPSKREFSISELPKTQYHRFNYLTHTDGGNKSQTTTGLENIPRQERLSVCQFRSRWPDEDADLLHRLCNEAIGACQFDMELSEQ